MDLEAVPLAKITPPSLSGVFPRKRLFRLIDTGRKRSIIWVNAPAGSGKTTLVASYLKERKLPSLWYHIDEGDADVATFFYHLGLAAKKASPRRRRPLPLFTREYMTGLSTFTARYFENLYARFHPPAVIVLDNYQDIPLDSPLHEVIRFGFTCIPEGMTSILISRQDPPVSLVTLRSKGIYIIGWEDLRLTSDESCGIARLRVPTRNKILKDMIGKFHCRAHGWVAGLILMLEQARLSGKETGPSIRSNQDVIFDYFAREIFQKLSQETRDFLLKASFLPHITPHSAEQLTGNHQAENILSILVQGNWFTFRYPHRGSIYQFHPLFREFLQESANKMFGFQEIMEIKCLAAELLLNEGKTEAAAQLLHEAGNYQKLSEVITGVGPMLIQQGRYQTLESWLHGMPGEFLEKDPWLLYWLGVCRTPFHLAGARESFEKAFSIFQKREDPAGLFLSWSSIVDTIIHEWTDFTSLAHWIETLG